MKSKTAKREIKAGEPAQDLEPDTQETPKGINRAAGTLSIDYTEARKITGKVRNLKAALKLNNKKGHFEVSGSVTNDQITGDEKRDKALIKAVAELMYKALVDGVEWRQEYEDAKTPGQIRINFG